MKSHHKALVKAKVNNMVKGGGKLNETGAIPRPIFGAKNNDSQQNA